MNGYATVKSISRRADGTRIVLCEVGNEFGSETMEYILLEELFSELSLETGEIAEELLELLEIGAETTSAFAAACSSLGFSLSSHKALRRKLLMKGFSVEASDRATGMIRERGYIDEVSVALRRAEIMAAKPWGRTRILAKLYDELFDPEALDLVKDYLDGIDFAESCARVILKKYRAVPQDRRLREAMKMSLARLGFSSSDIRGAIKLIEKE